MGVLWSGLWRVQWQVGFVLPRIWFLGFQGFGFWDPFDWVLEERWREDGVGDKGWCLLRWSGLLLFVAVVVLEIVKVILS